jgi:hypothetical protein
MSARRPGLDEKAPQRNTHVNEQSESRFTDRRPAAVSATQPDARANSDARFLPRVPAAADGLRQRQAVQSR